MKNYQDNLEKNIIVKLRQILSELPPYCKDYFNSLETRTTKNTQLAYAYDLNVFFNFLLESNPNFKTKKITLDELNKIDTHDIEEYMNYLKYYSANVKNKDSSNTISQTENTKEVLNSNEGIKRKMSSLRTFFNYLYKNEAITHDPTSKVLMPKLRQKAIIRLEPDEVAKLLDKVESGELLTKNEQKYHKFTKERDLAIMTLLLGTGIRVSECVGIDITDIDFNAGAIRIHRKGGKETLIYYGNEVKDALENYINNSRKKIIEEKNLDEQALFLSIQNKRLNQRSIEKLVKKYATSVTPLKHITPHKLRSTYGTNLYRETGDIYLVAEVLGHNDVNTTKKHYAAIDEDLKKSARNIVKLRSNTDE